MKKATFLIVIQILVSSLVLADTIREVSNNSSMLNAKGSICVYLQDGYSVLVLK